MTASEFLTKIISKKILVVVGFAFILMIYLLYPTKDYYHDGLDFASVIEAAQNYNQSLLHPNHLFYDSVGWFFYRLQSQLGFSWRSMQILQTLNSIFSVAALFVFFKTARFFLRSEYLSAWLVLLLAFSAAWWKYSTDADAYVPSVAFLLVSFYLLLPGKKPRPLLVAAIHALAMYFHELAVLFYPVAVLGLYLQSEANDFKRRSLDILKYSAAAFALTFGAYCLSFYWLTGGFEMAAFVHWITYFTPSNSFSFDLLHSFSETLKSSKRLFQDGRGGYFEQTPLMFGLLLVIGGLITVLIYKIGRSFGSLKDIRLKFPPDALQKKGFYLCAAWILPYAIFLFFFIPGNTFYRLFYLPALILLGGLFVESLKSAPPVKRRWRLATAILALGLANFVFYIHPLANVRSQTPLFLANELRGEWNEKTVVFYDEMTYQKLLVKYFNPQTVWKPIDELTREELNQKIADVYADGGNVWAENFALEKLSVAPGNEWLKAHSVNEKVYGFKDRDFELKFVKLVP